MPDTSLVLRDAFTSLSSAEADLGLSALKDARLAGWTAFQALGWPTKRHEEWRYTPLQPVLDLPFLPARPKAQPPFSLTDLHALAGGYLPPARLVTVNGSFSRDLSALPSEAGLTVASIADALRSEGPLRSSVISAFQAHAKDTFTNPLEALNLALAFDGFVLSVDEGAFLAEPIHILHLALPTASPTIAFPRCILSVAPHAQIQLVERFLSSCETPSVTAATTQIFVGENAFVDTTKLQEEAKTAFHFSQILIHQARNSRLSNLYVGLGGAIARQEIRVRLDGEATETTLHGLYIADGSRLMDNRTFLDHAHPNCRSFEVYQGILDDDGKGIFNGKILVRSPAQKTDAKQTNKALLLADSATLFSKPQLEIYADDVKCTHGATSGYLDEDAIFYLRSRGLSLLEAKSLLIYGFAKAMIEPLRSEDLRSYLESYLTRRFQTLASPRLSPSHPADATASLEPSGV